MRILHLTSHLDVGGITTYVVTLSEALAARGHEVLVASGGGALEARLERSRIAHWTLPLRTSAEFSPAVLWSAWQLDRRLAQHPVDMLHAHTRVAQVVAAWVSHRRGIPYVTTWHGFFRNRWSRRAWPCTGWLTIAISDPVRQSLRAQFGLPESRIRLIPNGVPVDYFASTPSSTEIAAARQQHGIPAGALVIGSVGRLASGPVKGYDRLLAAAARVMAEMPALHVVIAGEGPGRSQIETQARQLGLESRVHLVGTDVDGRVALALMDVFVFPVRAQEGFGLALIEAMASGKPVVATRTGAIPSIVRPDLDGLLVPEEDEAALAAAIRRLLQDRVYAGQLGQRAQQRVRETFNLDRVAEQAEAVYAECRHVTKDKVQVARGALNLAP